MTPQQVEARVGKPRAAYRVGRDHHQREYASVAVQYFQSRAVFVVGNSLERGGRRVLPAKATRDQVLQALGWPDEVRYTGGIPCYGRTKGFWYRASGVTANFGPEPARVWTFYLTRLPPGEPR